MDGDIEATIHRELVSSIGDATGDLLYAKDPDHRLVYAGETYAGLFDRERGELLGCTTQELWPNRAAELVAEERHVFDGERITDRERRIPHPDGSEHWYRVAKFPRYDDAGEVVGLVGFDREITDRKKRVRETECAQVRLEALTANSHLGILSISDDSVIRYASDGIREIFGYEPADVIGEPLDRLIPDRLEGGHEAYVDRYLRTGKRTLDWDWVEVPGVRVDGTEVPLGISFGEAVVGSSHRFTAVVRDISERRERAATLRKMRRAVEEAGLAIFITDDAGTIQYVNPAFEDITGYPAAEAVGRNPRILQSNEVEEGYYERLWDTIVAGDRWQEEIPNRRKSGELYYAQQTIAPIVEDGEVTQFVAIQQDITGRKQRGKHLQVFNRVLRHNHRNLLNLILGSVDSLAPAESDDGRLFEIFQETSAELHELSEKAFTMTQLLLDEERRVPITDLAAEIQPILEEFASDHPAADIALEVAQPVAVRAHPHLGRAIRELVENAIEHSGMGVSVSVFVVETRSDVAITVVDDGPGIPAHEYEVITGERELSQIHHGSGLGLWLAYWIVRRSGGTLYFDVSEAGTAIRIDLPLRGASDRRPITGSGQDHHGVPGTPELGDRR